MRRQVVAIVIFMIFALAATPRRLSGSLAVIFHSLSPRESACEVFCSEHAVKRCSSRAYPREASVRQRTDWTRGSGQRDARRIRPAGPIHNSTVSTMEALVYPDPEMKAPQERSNEHSERRHGIPPRPFAANVPVVSPLARPRCYQSQDVKLTTWISSECWGFPEETESNKRARAGC